MKLFHRKTTHEIEEAQASIQRAEASLDAAESQRPWVESVVGYVQERRDRNGFGDDFTITTNSPRFPLRKAH